jgi:prepilin-type N-terminal cleavage/methylation domain-containing protein
MRGFTLVEILVSVVILAFLFAAIYGVLNIGNIIFKDDMTLVQLQQQARQAMDGMIREIRQAKRETGRPITITLDGSEIEFYIPSFSNPISYYRDVNDVNNDGIIDQVIREYPPQIYKILANDITALNFSNPGYVVGIQLAAKLAARGRELCFPVPYCNDTSKTLKEKVRLRNE